MEELPDLPFVTVPTKWLRHRIRSDHRGWGHLVEALAPYAEEGDAYWFFEAPVPPEVMAGEFGVALVRGGGRHREVVRALVGGIH